MTSFHLVLRIFAVTQYVITLINCGCNPPALLSTAAVVSCSLKAVAVRHVRTTLGVRERID